MSGIDGCSSHVDRLGPMKAMMADQGVTRWSKEMTIDGPLGARSSRHDNR